MEDSGSMGDQDRDSIMGVNKDDIDQDDDECDPESDPWEGVTDSCPKSATGDDCHMCSDTEDVAAKSTHKKFHKKVQAPNCPTKQGLQKDAQLEQIGKKIAILYEEVTTKLLKQSEILLWIGTPAPSKKVGWQSTPTSHPRSRWPPTWETSTPDSMRPTLMEGRRSQHRHSSNSMPTITSYMTKAWSTPLWTYRAPTKVMLSCTLASLLAGAQIILILVPQMGQKHGDNCHPSL